MLGFNAPKKTSNSILKNNWPRNDVDVRDDPYEALILAYGREMDQLVEANTISSEEKEEDCETHLDDEMTKSNDEKERMVPRHHAQKLS
jgi:hypothetical protein